MNISLQLVANEVKSHGSMNNSICESYFQFKSNIFTTKCPGRDDKRCNRYAKY